MVVIARVGVSDLWERGIPGCLELLYARVRHRFVCFPELENMPMRFRADLDKIWTTRSPVARDRHEQESKTSKMRCDCGPAAQVELLTSRQVPWLSQDLI